MSRERILLALVLAIVLLPTVYFVAARTHLGVSHAIHAIQESAR